MACDEALCGQLLCQVRLSPLLLKETVDEEEPLQSQEVFAVSFVLSVTDAARELGGCCLAFPPKQCEDELTTEECFLRTVQPRPLLV